ncbi:MAG TPA: type III pantothenate kinase [Verrucomicrobiae bacterium]|nr:type III pantothenate kinase [Verrucomicrobiae bacterium]
MEPERRRGSKPATALLINANNTNTSFALANEKRIVRAVKVPTGRVGKIPFAANRYNGVVLASVVPAATKKLLRLLKVARASRLRSFPRRNRGNRDGRPTSVLIVNAFIDLGIGVRYPRKQQIGADRLANAAGVARLYGAPAIVVDFGTALTFDIVNSRREYVGGVIAPGLAAVTDYLYQRTALLPRISLREPRSVVGKSTVEAMRAGVVLGYRGLVREILAALRRERGLKNAVVVATGGYGELMARGIPEIERVNPLLTLEGLRFIYLRNRRSGVME